MNSKLQEKLFKKYNRLFADRTKSMQETCMCWGIECGDGWYTLLDCLCHAIEEHYWNKYMHENDNEYPEFDDFKAGKIKCKMPKASQVKEKYGGLRFYMDTFEPDDNYVDGAIRVAEQMSMEICEKCGKPGETNREGWISTLCEDCRNKKEDKWVKKS